MKEATETVGEKQKQDIIVGDNTGTTKVTLWEENVYAFQNGECYQLQNFAIQEFQLTRYLSTYGCRSYMHNITYK